MAIVNLRRAHVGFVLAALVAYIVVPYGSAPTPWLYLSVSVSAPLAIVIGACRLRPAKRMPWFLLAAGFVLNMAGDAVYTAYDLFSLGEVPYPGVSDAAYLASYPFVFVALASFVRAGSPRNRAAWLDAMIWTVGAAILAWEPLLQPYVTASMATPLQSVIAIGYPVMDLGLLLLLVRMLVGRRTRTVAYWLLVIQLSFQTMADVGYSLDLFGDSAIAYQLMDLGSLITYVSIGVVALHPAMVRLTEPTLEPAALSSRRRLVGLVIPALLAPGLMTYELITGQLATSTADVVVLVTASAVLLLLVLARAAGLLSVAERRSAQLADHQRQLETALAQLEVALVDRERSNTELNYRVTRDPLTGLANRVFFVTALEHALSEGGEPSIAFLDMNDFKSINDTLGHEAGDLLLVDLARRLASAVTSEDLVARFGGDEFAVLINGDLEEGVERLLDAFRTPMLVQGRELRLHVSIGVTTADRPGSTSGELLRRADVAMYTAKRAGGGWVKYERGMSTMLRRRMDLQSRLASGLRDGDVTPWFQPIVDLRSGRLRGFEALARWSPGGDTTLLPTEWLPMAEESGLVVLVDKTVCRAAIQQLATWRATYPAARELELAINLSARTLHEAGVAAELIGMLTDAAVPPNRIVLEVTEGVLIDDPEVSARLQKLRAAGVRVALDDFGTGWSSLSYLQRYPVDVLKLDQSFTAALGADPGGDAIPAAVLQLARAMSLSVVAEGVETPQQRMSLLALGFQQAQGHLFAEAQPAEQLEALLNESQPRLITNEELAVEVLYTNRTASVPN